MSTELRRYGRLVARWWWLLIAATAISAGAAYYFTRMQAPVYRASTSLLVNAAQNTPSTTYDDLLISQSLTRTYAELVRKRPVLDAVVKKVGLPFDADTLARQVHVTAVPNTTVIIVSVDDSNGELARDISNAIADAFIAQRMEDQMGQQNTARDVLRQQIADLAQQIKITSQQLDVARASKSPDNIEIGRLQDYLSQTQLTYSQLIKNDLDMRLAEAKAYTVATVVEPANAPLLPVGPNVPLNTLVGAAIGLLLAVAASFSIELLDDTVKGGDDIRQLVGLPTLGVIGRFPAVKAAALEPRLITQLGTNSSLTEEYRILRVNLDFAWADRRGQVILVTSANAGEGKTTTLANLAAVLADDNHRVIMVDGDLRRPALHHAFQAAASSGLTNLLAGPNARVADYVQPTNVPNLRLMSSGPIPPNPSELVGSARFRQVLEELKQMADLVLVDSPPLLPVADTPMMSAVVDGVILVVQPGVTRGNSLVHANQALTRGAVRVLGVVLNRVSGRSADYYYHNYRYVDGSSDGVEKHNGAEKHTQALVQ